LRVPLFFSIFRPSAPSEITMPSLNPPKPPNARRVELEVERERQEHAMNQDAKHYLGDDDERLKDARETSFSSTVRRSR
jgi:hypothetical protein